MVISRLTDFIMAGKLQTRMQGVDDSTAAVGGVPVINANVPRYKPTKRKRGQRGRDQKSRKVRESPLTAGAKAQALKDKNQGRMVN